MTLRSRPSTRLRPLTATLLVVGVACAETRYEGETGGAATDGTVAPSTAPLAVEGTAVDLLPLLVGEATDLSRRLIEDDGADDAVVRIDELWQAVREEVAAARPELLDDFDANVRRLASAVEFDRAADADKAGQNLKALVDAYVG